MRPKMKATSVAVVVTAGNGAIRVLLLKAKGEVWGSTNGTFLFINQDVVKEQNCCHIICFYFDGEKLSKDMHKTSEQRTTPSESESRLSIFLGFPPTSSCPHAVVGRHFRWTLPYTFVGGKSIAMCWTIAEEGLGLSVGSDDHFWTLCVDRSWCHLHRVWRLIERSQAGHW